MLRANEHYLARSIHDQILAQHLCPQILIMDTNFQPVTTKNARGHYCQHPLKFKRALVELSPERGVRWR